MFSERTLGGARVRVFKTDPTQTVAFCFGCPKTPCGHLACGKLSSLVDKTQISTFNESSVFFKNTKTLTSIAADFRFYAPSRISDIHASAI
jgi:hypothetical protein